MSRVPDGPLHDHDGERAQARAEAVDALVEGWSQDSDQIALTLARDGEFAGELAACYEYSDELFGKEVRKLIGGALRARAERETDA